MKKPTLLKKFRFPDKRRTEMESAAAPSRLRSQARIASDLTGRDAQHPRGPASRGVVGPRGSNGKMEPRSNTMIIGLRSQTTDNWIA